MKTLQICVIFLITLLTSCGVIEKEIVADELVGDYEGTVTYTVQLSLLNVGLDDVTEEQEISVNIFRDSNDNMFLTTDEGRIKLSALTMASNGALFNIPYQSVVQKDKSRLIIQGFQVAELDGVKYDGIYYSERNVLNVGYETVVKYDYWDAEVEVSVLCNFEFSKSN